MNYEILLRVCGLLTIPVTTDEMKREPDIHQHQVPNLTDLTLAPQRMRKLEGPSSPGDLYHPFLDSVSLPMTYIFINHQETTTNTGVGMRGRSGTVWQFIDVELLASTAAAHWPGKGSQLEIRTT